MKKFCCDQFEWMIATCRIQIPDFLTPDEDPYYEIIDMQERLIKSGCTHCMFCGKRFVMPSS